MNGFDFSELKWVVFDECDKIKDDNSGEFKQILNLFSNKNVPTNVPYRLLSSSSPQQQDKKQSFSISYRKISPPTTSSNWTPKKKTWDSWE
jgi:hypothetical protein